VAVDGAGNRSQPAGPVPATALGAALFTDGFESGGLSQWFRSAGLTVVESPVRTGRYAAHHRQRLSRLRSRGALAFRNDVTGSTTTSSTVLAAGTW
jgi:hypothetical protein